MAKKKEQIETYEVLRLCENARGKMFHPGDTVTSDDFPLSILQAWAKKRPPVVRPVKGDDS